MQVIIEWDLQKVDSLEIAKFCDIILSIIESNNSILFLWQRNIEHCPIPATSPNDWESASETVQFHPEFEGEKMKCKWSFNTIHRFVMT